MSASGAPGTRIDQRISLDHHIIIDSEGANGKNDRNEECERFTVSAKIGGNHARMYERTDEKNKAESEDEDKKKEGENKEEKIRPEAVCNKRTLALDPHEGSKIFCK